jgi:hypothetical protein
MSFAFSVSYKWGTEFVAQDEIDLMRVGLQNFRVYIARKHAKDHGTVTGASWLLRLDDKQHKQGQMLLNGALWIESSGRFVPSARKFCLDRWPT